MLLRPFTIDDFGQFGPLTYTTLHGSPYPLKTKQLDQRAMTIGPGHAPARHALQHNYHPAAPEGLFPKAEKQWKRNLEEQHKRHTTHWFTSTYHACLQRLPSQCGESKSSRTHKT